MNFVRRSSWAVGALNSEPKPPKQLLDQEGGGDTRPPPKTKIDNLNAQAYTRELPLPAQHSG